MLKDLHKHLRRMYLGMEMGESNAPVPNTFVAKYAASYKDISTYAPYCFFNNFHFAQKYKWAIIGLSDGWTFGMQECIEAPANGRSHGNSGARTDYNIGVAQRQREVDTGLTSKPRSQLFINMYILFYHWAKHDSADPSSDKYVVNNTGPRSLDAKIDQTILDPAAFSLATCLNDWARLFPLECEVGCVFAWRDNLREVREEDRDDEKIEQPSGEEDLQFNADHCSDEAMQMRLYMQVCMQKDLAEIHSMFEDDTRTKDPVYVAKYLPNEDECTEPTHKRQRTDSGATPSDLRARGEAMIHAAVQQAFGSGADISTFEGRKRICLKAIPANLELPTDVYNDDYLCCNVPFVPRTDIDTTPPKARPEELKNASQAHSVQYSVIRTHGIDFNGNEALFAAATKNITPARIDKLQKYDIILIDGLNTKLFYFDSFSTDKYATGVLFTARRSRDSCLQNKIYKCKDRVLACHDNSWTPFRFMLGKTQLHIVAKSEREALERRCDVDVE